MKDFILQEIVEIFPPLQFKIFASKAIYNIFNVDKLRPLQQNIY